MAFLGGRREGVARFGCGNGVCMGVHFSNVEWLGDIGGVRGMEVGHVCAVGVEWL